jgi:hypothetical protein
MWFALPPPSPTEVLEVEHPAATAEKRRSNPTGIRRVRSEPFPRKAMSPPVSIFRLETSELIPKRRGSPTPVIILYAKSQEKRKFYAIRL